MKNFYLIASLGLLGDVFAFPAIADNFVESAVRAIGDRDLTASYLALQDPEIQARQLADAQYEAVPLEKRQQKGGFPEPKPPFSEHQRVSIDGEHKFVAPDFEAGDVRGPCPGLNAAANHGYLPHNGVGGPTDFIKGLYEVFGMGPDLATILTTIGGSLDGDGVNWSIGGISKYNPSPVPGVLGSPQGISGSHNKYEGDVSPTRGDLYKFGNDYELQMPQFKELYQMGQANGDHYSIQLLNDFRANRFHNSIATNPYFFNGPFSGLLVQPAAFEFIYRFMGNKSALYPRGHLNSDVLMTFFGVTKDKNGDLTHKPGFEAIPYNWYKRNVLDPYGQNMLNADTLTSATINPLFATVGGNTGKVNTFKGVDPKDLTGGVINSKNILQGNNLACLAYEFEAQASPDLIKCGGVISDFLGASKKLQAAIGKVTASMNCPTIKKIDTKQFAQYPGYSKLQCDSGNYPSP